MKIVNKLSDKNRGIYEYKPVTIAFLGDSVTQGCFECYYKLDGNLETVFDYDHSFSNKLRKLLNYLYPAAQINIVNSGISGDNADNGNRRFGRDIAPYSPDLVVVSYGLNDCFGKSEGLQKYLDALENIFDQVKSLGAECIFLTPNLINSEISPHLPDERLVEIAKSFIDNCLDDYIEAAKVVAKKNGVTVCDVHAKWKLLRAGGVNTTELLSNKLNHPTREMTTLTAYSLAETIFSE